MPSHKNRVQMTVTGTPGTGTITLNAASSGYRSFATAYGADATVDILIVDGTSWEIARNCTYTHSGTTLSRGTLESSSAGADPGSAISLTSAAVVSVIATADRGRTWDAAALEHVAGTDANVTMLVNSLYVVDMSAWATADRTYTLPATAAVGDRVGIMVSSGDASHELLITANTGDTLNGVAGGTEWSRLFITGEVVIMRCVAASATWVVEDDGRIPQQGLLRLSTAATAETLGTWTQPSTKSGVWTADINIGSVTDAANDRIIPRRLGKYCLTAGYVANSVTSAADKSHGCGLYIDSSAGTLITNSIYYVSLTAGRGFSACAMASYNLPALGNGICYTFYSDEGSRGALASASSSTQRCFLSVVEVLP